VQAPGEPQQPLQPIPPLVTAAPAAESAPVPPVQPAAPAPAEPAGPLGVADMRDVPLGTLVFRAGLLPEERLEEALQEGMKTGKRLGEILLERGWVSENDLGRLLAGQKGLPFVELDPAAIDPTAPPLLHPEKARLHGALPIGFEGGVPVVAVADPSNDLVVENVRRALACEPVLVVAGRDALLRTINQAYGAEAPAQPVAEPAPVQVAEPVAEPAAAPVAEPVAEPAASVPVVEPVVAVPVAESQPVVQVVEPQPVAPVVEPVTPVVDPVEPVAPAMPVVEPVAPVAVEPMEPVAAVVEAQQVVEEVPTQPAQNSDGLWLGLQPDAPAQPEIATQPQPVADVVAPEPVVAEPVAAAAPAPVVPAAPEPVFETAAEPVAVPVADPQPAPEPRATWTIELRLTNGERLELGSFAGEAEATERARAVVADLASENGWPFVAGRFIRPDVIISVDLIELEVTRWLGSSARAAALTAEQQPV
jgi:hypothetical protein